MRLKRLTKQQKKKFKRLSKEWEHLYVEGVMTLADGEDFILFRTIDMGWDGKDDFGFPMEGFGYFALPVSLLDEDEVDLYDIPRAIWQFFSFDAGSLGYPFRKNVLEHIDKNYPDLPFHDLYCVELDGIHVESYQGRGLGTFLLERSLEEIRLLAEDVSIDLELGLTHILGEMMPDDEDRIFDLMRFYRKHGFQIADPFIYQLVHPG